MNIKNDILRLAEMQYRKGFEAGFEACQNQKTTLEKVKEWKFSAFKTGYRDHTSLYGSNFHNFEIVLKEESKAARINKIFALLQTPDEKPAHEVKVIEINELHDNTIEIILLNAESFSDSQIKEIIQNAFKCEIPKTDIR